MSSSIRLPSGARPAGPRTSGPPPRKVSDSELNELDHLRVAVPWCSENLSTLPVWFTAQLIPDTDWNWPASATYRLPWPSKATPRGPFRPDTTGVNVQVGAAAATLPPVSPRPAPRTAISRDLSADESYDLPSQPLECFDRCTCCWVDRRYVQWRGSIPRRGGSQSPQLRRYRLADLQRTTSADERMAFDQ